MTQDHFVSITYLKHFADSNEKLYVYKKNMEGEKYFYTTPDNVCKMRNGDLLKGTMDENLLKEHLRYFEEKWNRVINNIKEGNFTKYERWFVAGYLATLITINPNRIEGVKKSLKDIVDTERILLSKKYYQENKKMYNALSDIENIKTVVNKNYAKALSFSLALALQYEFFCGKWILFVNNDENTPFITSDNPVCMYYSNFSSYDPIGGFRYFPLSTKFGVFVGVNPYEERKIFNPKKIRTIADLPDTSENIKTGSIKSEDVKQFNDLVIKCAENFIISNKENKHIEQKVEELKNFRMRSKTQVFPVHRGFLNINTIEITDKD